MNTENISKLITTSIWKIQLPSSSFISRSICDGWTGFVLIYRLCSRVARNLTFRGESFIFLLTPITSSKKCSESKSGFSRKGMSAGSMLTILSRARLNRTRSAHDCRKGTSGYGIPSVDMGTICIPGALAQKKTDTISGVSACEQCGCTMD